MSERVCKQCGASLKHRNVRAMFCCEECGHLYRKAQRRAPLPQKVCVVCGKSFVPYRSNHVCCSIECSTVNKKAKRDTYNKVRNQRAKKQKAPKICIICGESFTPSHSKAICCSYACSKKRNIEKGKARKQANQSGFVAETQGFYKNCIVCGKTFFSNQPSSLMCSDACRRIRKQQQYAMDMMQVYHQAVSEAGAEMSSYMTANGFG